MDRHLLLFGNGTHFASGSLPDCLAMTLRTGGLNGTIQPYSIFVAEPQNDGPYEQRSKFTTNTQNDAIFQTNKIFKEGKMVSTEYTKGHGSSNGIVGDADDGEIKNSSQSVDSVDSSKVDKETVHIVHVNPYSEKDNEVEDTPSVKMSKKEFEKKISELSDRSNPSKRSNSGSNLEPEKNKKQKTHKFKLF